MTLLSATRRTNQMCRTDFKCLLFQDRTTSKMEVPTDGGRRVRSSSGTSFDTSRAWMLDVGRKMSRVRVKDQEGKESRARTKRGSRYKGKLRRRQDGVLGTHQKVNDDEDRPSTYDNSTRGWKIVRKLCELNTKHQSNPWKVNSRPRNFH